jgi:hypothetical protein
MKLLIIVVMLSVSGCVAGPLSITHREGEMPKVRVKMPIDNMHLRARHNKIILKYRKRF